jgi:hypothetical protein
MLAQADQLMKEGMDAFLNVYPNLTSERQAYYAALGFVTEVMQKMRENGQLASDWDQGFNAGYEEGRKSL